MKKNILTAAAVILLLAVIICGVNIQSVDEYYQQNTDGTGGAYGTVTISIRCDTILENYEDLDAALRSEEFVPADGVILAETAYALSEGDTVFTVLERAVRDHRIQMEYQGGEENALGGVYIQGIHYLYEFSCGPLSGWMFRVNGEYPDCACSQYELGDGDVIEWIYTCDLGKDIGNTWAGGETE